MNLLHKLPLLLLIALPCQLSAQLADNSNNEQEHPDGIETFRESKYSKVPSYLEFQKGNEIQLEQFQDWTYKNLKINDQMGFILLSSENDNIGFVHYRYQQTYMGQPIEDAIWIVHSKDGIIRSFNGMIYERIKAPQTASLTEIQALEKAKAFVGAESYKWELPEEEEHLKWEQGDESATYAPNGELVFISSTPDYNARAFRLAYKFNIYAHKPLYRAELFVDANTGDIIRENQLIHHVDEPGTAHTAYSGEREIIADSFDGSYRLRDGSRGNGVRTFDLNQSTSFGDAVDFVDADNNWDNVNPQQDEYATDAHWGAEKTYDYYNDVHGRNSLDDAGFQLNSYVHYDVGFFNAFWDGTRMTYGDGDGMPSTPLTTLDIAGHEVTHGLTNFTADLIYSSESGALNESFSDIFGTAIEAFARPDEWDWLLGDETGVPIRSISNPNDFDCPDTYEGDFWDDFEEVHTNSGVQNHWYYLLVEGGSGTNDNGDAFTVTSIGMDAASAIAFRNLTVYLTPSSDYSEARYYSIQAAADLFGGCTDEVEQTTNAWHAVGVGDVYSSEVIANFSADETVGCEVPFTVNFENESVNGIDYVWDFGDDETSTEAFPSHTYAAEGIYDVTLSVDGGSCGEDEIVNVGFITIDLSLDCPIIFPTDGGTGVPYTSCEGTIFDSGGADGNYGLDENGIITVSPADEGTVELTFVSLDIETGPSCAYDNLKIYDGASVASPLLGSYCNSNPPPTTLESSGGSLTIAFESDNFFVLGGFELTWECKAPIDDTGIEEFENKSISIYPNPSNGFITVSLDKIESGTIEITDILGKQIIESPFYSNKIEMNLAKYGAKGVYLVHIRDNSGQLVGSQKVVID